MKFEKTILPYLVLVAALMVSFSAAFYSVTGIGKMFSGEMVNVMILIGSVEFAKLVLASFIYQYWEKISIIMKFWYISSLVIMMAITSGGIYGFLTSAYSDTSMTMQIQDKEVMIIQSKKDNLSDRLADYQTEKATINTNISELTKGLANNKIQYIDKETGEKITTTSSATRKVFQKQLEDAKERRDKISSEIIKLSEEIGEFDREMLEIEYDPETSGEIGILKSISELTGKASSVVINWFIWAIMLVFDPLAISLVLGANMIFKERSREEDNEELANTADDKIKELKAKEVEFDKISKDFEKRLKAVSDKEEAFNQNTSSITTDIEERENEIKERERKIEDKLINLNDSKTKTKGEIKVERNKLTNMQYEITEERARLVQDKEDFKKDNVDIIEAKKSIEKEKHDLQKRSDDMDAKYEEYVTLKKQIDAWKALHWKRRRNVKPPGT
jgi:predicted  nucleic acid-binding Zn-ribbon protein